MASSSKKHPITRKLASIIMSVPQGPKPTAVIILPSTSTAPRPRYILAKAKAARKIQEIMPQSLKVVRSASTNMPQLSLR
ncbi:hypothetical protein ES703_15386 [subsurface metagenome]